MTDASGIAKEIERKYLLNSLPSKVETASHKFMVIHGWIPGEVIQERITWNNRGDGEFWRAIKTGKGLERIEAQERIDAALYVKLIDACGDRRIEKTRYCIPEGNLVWEIDEFVGKLQGLYLAEIEIPSTDFEVSIPPWFLYCMVKEVTDDPDYLNINLVKREQWIDP